VVRERKPLVGAASLTLALVLAAATAEITGSPQLAAAAAAMPTLVAPLYYVLRRRVLAAAAAGVLASMASGALAWLALAREGLDPSVPDPVLFAAAGLLTGGVASHAAASTAWAAAIDLLYSGHDGALAAVLAGTALGLTTALGASMVLAMARGRPGVTASLAVVAAAAVALLAAYEAVLVLQ